MLVQVAAEYYQAQALKTVSLGFYPNYLLFVVALHRASSQSEETCLNSFYLLWVSGTSKYRDTEQQGRSTTLSCNSASDADEDSLEAAGDPVGEDLYAANPQYLV